MTLEQLKNKVRDLIGKARIKEALDLMATWAHENNHAQLKSDVTLKKSDLATLDREKTLGLISGGEASTRQNKLTYSILNLLDGLDEAGSEPYNPKPVPGKPNPTKPRIYFSYAWGDDNETGDSREKIVGELYDSLKADGFDVIRDKENLDYRDMISDFMREIGQGDYIVVAISDKYLKSPNCMFEMYEIYRNSKLDRNLLRQKVYPIRVESIRLSDPKVLDQYFEYWENQEKEWEDLIVRRGTRISPAQHEKYRRIKSIASELGDFLDFLSDINAKTKGELSAGDFGIIKNALLTAG